MENTMELTDDDESCLDIQEPDVPDETIILSSDDESTVISSDEELPSANKALQEKKSAVIKNLRSLNNNQPTASSRCNLKDSILSSDNDNSAVISSDEELPSTNMTIQEKRSALIKNLFPSTNKNINKPAPTSSCNLKDFKRVHPPTLPFAAPKTPRDPGINRMIEGVNVNLPVNPYGCQVALMSMLIKAIKGGKNCLLESPTGSGKTLALLCAALGWLSKEKKLKADLQAKSYFSSHPELNQVEGAMEYVTSPMKKPPGSPEKFFSKNTFGEKSIYDKSSPNGSGDSVNTKRQDPSSFEQDSPEIGLVGIHKKRKLDAMECDENGPLQSTSIPKHTTPEKKINQPDPVSPELRVPTIYYGARTHKQLQQVIKEFGRTSYSDSMKMTLLSSREYSCIREFDRQMWSSKNEMCRGCVKKLTPKDDTHRSREETNCKFYDNRQALKPERLPSAFDLEDLVKAGHELTACPYYAAREMASQADIVFCPYNYLIEPAIRSSMRIDLTDNILIVDEAHNIEDICRDAATFCFTREEVQSALKELEVVSEYRYASPNQEIMSDIDRLLKVMKDWDYWFQNQLPLVESASFNSTGPNSEATHSWEPEHFLRTLDHHDIGQNHYSEIQESATKFCNQLSADPRTLFGVTQATGTLVESFVTALGYLFREGGKYKDDFKPILVKSVTGDTTGSSNWRNSQFKKMTETPALRLRLICLNPGVVFESLKVSKCVVLASGTLTPLVSLHSELGAEFPLKISPSHIIPAERVWIGTLIKHQDGRSLECKAKDTEQADTQDSLGAAVLQVCRLAPHGVLCFLPSYRLMNSLVSRWQTTGVWQKLHALKNVFQENRNARDHNDIMEDYYTCAATAKGALLFAVYRGKVSEGMDFKDHQARAVIAVGVPYPNSYDMAVKAKMAFNDKYSRERKLLSGQEWLKVQAYRALNQAVGRCVRHKGDWGAVLLVDGRFLNSSYTEHLSKWVRNFLEGNHHTFQSLVHGANSLESFMQSMQIADSEDL